MRKVQLLLLYSVGELLRLAAAIGSGYWLTQLTLSQLGFVGDGLFSSRRGEMTYDGFIAILLLFAINGIGWLLIWGFSFLIGFSVAWKIIGKFSWYWDRRESHVPVNASSATYRP